MKKIFIINGLFFWTLLSIFSMDKNNIVSYYPNDCIYIRDYKKPNIFCSLPVDVAYSVPLLREAIKKKKIFYSLHDVVISKQDLSYFSRYARNRFALLKECVEFNADQNGNIIKISRQHRYFQNIWSDQIELFNRLSASELFYLTFIASKMYSEDIPSGLSIAWEKLLEHKMQKKHGKEEFLAYFEENKSLGERIFDFCRWNSHLNKSLIDRATIPMEAQKTKVVKKVGLGKARLEEDASHGIARNKLRYSPFL